MNRMTIHEFTATLDQDTTPAEPTAITHHDTTHHETIVGWYIPTPTNPQQQPTHTHVDTEDHRDAETSGPTPGPTTSS